MDEMDEDVKIEVEITSFPVISTNFEKVEKELELKLKQYDLVVSEEDIPIAKKFATEIMKLKREINSLKSEKIQELSIPIEKFKNSTQKLISQCDNARNKLLSQISKYEKTKIAECLNLLKQELADQYKKLEVAKEFHIVKVDDLAIISNLNKSGISKKARDAIEERVLAALAKQKTVETRLLQLEGFCLKNGLEVSLTREHINHFLLLDSNAAYESKLMALIKMEVARQEQIKNRARKEANFTQTVNHQPVNTNKHHQNQNSNTKILFNPANVKKTGVRSKYVVTATFEIDMDEGYEPEIENMLLDKFSKAEFKIMPDIEVEKVSNDLVVRQAGSLF